MPGPKFRYIFQILISSWLNVSFYDPTLLDADLTNHVCNLLMLSNAHSESLREMHHAVGIVHQVFRSGEGGGVTI